ncbi:hypothetical protein ALO75_200265 [Pseudomonas syringae pv. coryli]|uniref:Killer protein n=1 Tax=Pseudomonas syringae pv. coryli TaxID=317659 RepID=A0A0P9M1N9_9PSED|nr:hypothetical protein ALO75_200265 [Pseudomonas syringae pv. coryli]
MVESSGLRIPEIAGQRRHTIFQLFNLDRRTIECRLESISKAVMDGLRNLDPDV